MEATQYLNDIAVELDTTIESTSDEGIGPEAVICIVNGVADCITAAIQNENLTEQSKYLDILLRLLNYGTVVNILAVYREDELIRIFHRDFIDSMVSIIPSDFTRITDPLQRDTIEAAINILDKLNERVSIFDIDHLIRFARCISVSGASALEEEGGIAFVFASFLNEIVDSQPYYRYISYQSQIFHDSLERVARNLLERGFHNLAALGGLTEAAYSSAEKLKAKVVADGYKIVEAIVAHAAEGDLDITSEDSYIHTCREPVQAILGRGRTIGYNQELASDFLDASVDYCAAESPNETVLIAIVWLLSDHQFTSTIYGKEETKLHSPQASETFVRLLGLYYADGQLVHNIVTILKSIIIKCAAEDMQKMFPAQVVAEIVSVTEKSRDTIVADPLVGRDQISPKIFGLVEDLLEKGISLSPSQATDLAKIAEEKSMQGTSESFWKEMAQTIRTYART